MVMRRGKGSLPDSHFSARILFEHIDAELVGDAGVVGGEAAGGVVEEGLGEGEGDGHFHAGVFVDLVFEGLGHFGSEAEVEEGDLMAVEVFPEGSGFVVVFGIDDGAGAIDVSATGGGAEDVGFDVGAGVDFDPFVGVDAGDPAMAGIGLVGVAVEVVADSELVGELLMIGAETSACSRVSPALFFSVTSIAEGGEGGIAEDILGRLP
jgi:hypothetical protein